MYDAVVLDVDGVLVRPDHLALHRRAVRAAFARHGVEEPAEADVEAMTLDVTLADIRRVADGYGFDPAAFWETRDRLSSAIQMQSVADGYKQPYADTATLGELDVPMAAVSTNQQPTLEFLLAHFGLDEHLEVVHGRAPTLADVRRRKPAPYFVTRALSDLRLGNGGDLDPDRALMVGDSESDVRAAHAAGADAAFVRREHRRDHDLAADPEHELAGLDELPGLVDGA